MAKKNSSSAAKTIAAKTSTPAVVTTPVRNSAVPPKASGIAAPARKSAPTHDMVSLTAYYIWKSSGGNSFDNWIRAERELTGL